MTREKAIVVTKALDAIDSFEIFMDEVQKVIYDCGVEDFENNIMSFLENELNNRKKILEQL